jgi:hypothetical protein
MHKGLLLIIVSIRFDIRTNIDEEQDGTKQDKKIKDK